MTKPWIYYCSDEAELLEKSVENLRLLVNEILKIRSECRIGLAGGSTPKALYVKWANLDFPWEKLKLIQLDERYVPSDSKESNLKMLRESLLSHIAIPPENLMLFDTSLPYKSSAEEMDRKLKELDQHERPLIDILILGAGSDGHIASLFENDAALDSTDLATTASAQGYPTVERLTLTLPALRGSRGLLLLKGPEKTSVVQALEGDLGYPPLTVLRKYMQGSDLSVLAYLQKP